MRCCDEDLFPFFLGQFFGLPLPDSFLIRSASGVSAIKTSSFYFLLGLVVVRAGPVLRAISQQIKEIFVVSFDDFSNLLAEKCDVAEIIGQ